MDDPTGVVRSGAGIRRLVRARRQFQIETVGGAPVVAAQRVDVQRPPTLWMMMSGSWSARSSSTSFAGAPSSGHRNAAMLGAVGGAELIRSAPVGRQEVSPDATRRRGIRRCCGRATDRQ